MSKRRFAVPGAHWQLVFLVSALAVLFPPLIARAGTPAAAQVGDMPDATVPAEQGSVAGGTMVQAATFDVAPKPSATDLQLATDATAQSPRPGPPGTFYDGPLPAPSGPGVAPPGATGGASTQAVNTFRIFRNTNLPAGGVRSPVNEPSSDNNGKNVFAVGNWYAAFSKNSGGAWTYLDPFTIFGGGFCCDQLAVYETSHNRQFWLLQYNNHLTTANSRGTDLVNWCFYNWAPANFGLPSTYVFDYNHMAVSTRHLFVSTNVYNPNNFVGNLVFRLPIDEMSRCAGFGFNFIFRPTEFSVAFAQSAVDTMHLITNWTSDLVNGSQVRIGRWADDSGTIFYNTRNIDPYAFLTVPNGNCASTNGVVLNWCQRTDSRMDGGGYLGLPMLGNDNSQGARDNEGILGFAFNAQEDGGHPFPYTRRVYFRENDLTYLGSTELWATWGAFIYPELAADARGHVGWVTAWGGGDPAISCCFFPGTAILINDDYAQAQPWDLNFVQFGAGNPCLNVDGLRRWGDYLSVRPYSPARYVWLATGFAMLVHAGACNADHGNNVQVKNVVFGRERDTDAFKRFK